jgi:hypothetical protein
MTVKSMNIQTLTFISILLTTLIGCNSKRYNQLKISASDSLTENFDEFYNRFHSDSLFQMSRIKFPLQGGSAEDVEWTKENWNVLKTKIYDVDTSKFKIKYKRTDKKFTEKFWIENSGYWSEYRFEVIGGKWFLVYALYSND